MTVKVGQYRMCRYVGRVYKVVEMLSPTEIFIHYVGDISSAEDRRLTFSERMLSQDRVGGSLIMSIIFYLHKQLYGYPCREHVRQAILLGRASNSKKYRVAMLYVCGYDIKETAEGLGMSEAEVKQCLTLICLEVG